MIAEQVHERIQAIKEALHKLRAESRAGVRVRGWNFILAQVEALLKYEEREISTTCPPPSTLLQDFRTMRDADLAKG